MEGAWRVHGGCMEGHGGRRGELAGVPVGAGVFVVGEN